MINKKLYSNLIEERLATAKNFSDNEIVEKITSLKKHYWFGSANAWVVFLGISPGGSPPKGKEDILNYKSQITI